MGLRIPVAAALLLTATSALAQPGYQPKNDEPNPYQPGVSWGKLPDGRTWGATGGVDIAPMAASGRTTAAAATRTAAPPRPCEMRIAIAPIGREAVIGSARGTRGR